MSGLQDYYNSVSAYSSNADSVNSFLSNYDDTFYSNFNDKVNEVKEQGKALVEAGGAVEGVYVGFKGVQKGVQAWRAKYGKKSGGDGDETGAGDDSNAGGGTEGETSGGLEDAGFTEEDAAGLFPDEAAPAGGGGGAPAGGGGDPDPIEGADPDAPFPDAPEVPVDFGGGTGQIQPASGDPAPPPEAPPSQAPDIDATYNAPEAPGDLPANFQGGGEMGQVGSAGEGAGAGGGEGAAGTDAVVAGGEEAGTEAATGVLTSVLGEGGVAALGVVAEAVPVLGGIAAIGHGLYELFHHSSKPKPPPAPMQSVSSKGELVTPSFDSVTDTPASQAAF